MRGGESERNGFETTTATVAFVDLAGFSAITDVYGDGIAIALLERFEAMVREALDGHAPPIKWIGDEVMLGFPDPVAALTALGRLLPACRLEPSLPLTRTALNHGSVIRRGGDLFGSTVNIAARMAALASPGQLLATASVASIATASGIEVRELGDVRLRSVAHEVALYSIELADTADPDWIDPVCKMHAPYAAYSRPRSGPWFCSDVCAEAYARAPEIYPRPKASG